jgi:hypothetical protein
MRLWLTATLAISLLVPAAAPVAQAAPVPGGLDGRAWELVSPAEKNGGQVGAPGTDAGGVLQAASNGDGVAFGADASFGTAEGAAPVSQYLASRGEGAWSTRNLTPPLLSGTYEGDPYFAFSDDLARGLLGSGWHCRDDSTTCPAENPPLGSGGPPGYRNIYLREGAAYMPLVTTANAPLLSVPANQFKLSFGAGSPNLAHIVISTCAALVAGAAEVPSGEGCDEAEQNLYMWESGQLKVINILPASVVSAPGASIPSAPGAVSTDGLRVYWSRGGTLYLRQGETTRVVSEGGSFQAASRDGSVAFFIKEAHLIRYRAQTEQVTDLTPSGGALAMIGSSSDGEQLFYVASDGLYRFEGGIGRKLFNSNPAQLPPASGRARVSADGSRLFFTARGVLHPKDINSNPDVYEWEAVGKGSCEKAEGCIGLISDGNGLGGGLADVSSSGNDVFFTTPSSLVGPDPGAVDLYDARVGGGLPEPQPPSECEGDDCLGPAPAPEDPTPGTATINARSNPPLSIVRHKTPKGRHHKRRHRRHRHRGHKQVRGGGHR